MSNSSQTERSAQDAFQSMVGGTKDYPDDPQHPDPGFEVDVSMQGSKESSSCPVE